MLHLSASKTLKRLLSFLCSVHKSEIGPCHPIGPLLKKTTKFDGIDNFESHLQYNKNHVAQAAEKTDYKTKLETQIQSDASRSGAALEQS